MIHQKCWLTQSALVQSVLDGIADRAHIIETGAESYHSQNPGDALEKQNILGSWFYSAGQGKELKAPFLPLQPILAGTEDRTTEQASSVNTGGVKSSCQMQLGHAIRRGPCGAALGWVGWWRLSPRFCAHMNRRHANTDTRHSGSGGGLVRKARVSAAMVRRYVQQSFTRC